MLVWRGIVRVISHFGGRISAVGPQQGITESAPAVPGGTGTPTVKYELTRVRTHTHAHTHTYTCTHTHAQTLLNFRMDPIPTFLIRFLTRFCRTLTSPVVTASAGQSRAGTPETDLHRFQGWGGVMTCRRGGTTSLSANLHNEL